MTGPKVFLVLRKSFAEIAQTNMTKKTINFEQKLQKLKIATNKKLNHK